MVSGTAIVAAERISIENHEFINEMKHGISRIYDLMSFFAKFSTKIYPGYLALFCLI